MKDASTGIWLMIDSNKWHYVPDRKTFKTQCGFKFGGLPIGPVRNGIDLIPRLAVCKKCRAAFDTATKPLDKRARDGKQ